MFLVNYMKGKHIHLNFLLLRCLMNHTMESTLGLGTLSSNFYYEKEVCLLEIVYCSQDCCLTLTGFSLFAKSSIPLPLRKSILCFKFIVIMIVAKPGVLFCLFLCGSFGKREIIVILVGLSSIGIQLNLMLLRTWFRQPTLSIFFILRLYFHFEY